MLCECRIDVIRSLGQDVVLMLNGRVGIQCGHGGETLARRNIVQEGLPRRITKRVSVEAVSCLKGSRRV
jgi:hypothetical protein